MPGVRVCCFENADQKSQEDQKAREAKAQDYKIAGNNLFQLKKFEEAIEQFSQAIALTPNDEKLYSKKKIFKWIGFHFPHFEPIC